MSEYASTEFWQLYESYVQESLPRHQQVVRMFGVRTSASQRVLDLGCGRSKESKRLFPVPTVFTVDVDLLATPDIVADYRALEAETLSGLHPVGFISLFSAECTADHKSNTALYESLFRQMTFLEWGLVSGFYYRERETEACVTEAGGIVSWQSNTPLPWSYVYSETRITLDAPSTLFGPDVVEVWKLLERRRP